MKSRSFDSLTRYLHMRYLDSWERATEEWINGNEDAADRVFLYGIRYLSKLDRASTEYEAVVNFDTFTKFMSLFQSITPRRFVRIFPINKNFDGEKTETKDYFYTIKMIESIGWDKPIEGAFDFLWDYQNRETRKFLLRVIQADDDLRKFQGQISIAEEWAQENGIRIFRAHVDEKTGKQFVIDSDGRSAPIRSVKPNRLKLVR